MSEVVERVARAIKPLLADFVSKSRIWDAARAALVAMERQGVCGECWYSAWVPVPTEEECELGHPHDGEHARCDYCWLASQYRRVAAMADAMEAAIDEAIEVLREAPKWTGWPARTKKDQRDVEALDSRIMAAAKRLRSLRPKALRNG